MSASNNDQLQFSKKKQLKSVITKDEFKAIYADEASLQRQCEAYLEYSQITFIRIPDAIYRFVFGFNSNMSPQFKKLISSFIKGLPDITILYKDGTYQCIELKTKKNKLSQGQKHFRDKVANYFVVRSFDEFKSIVRTI